MKAASWMAAGFLTLAGGGVTMFADELEASTAGYEPKLTVELRDGSRVVGACTTGQMRFHSRLLGELEIAVTNIQSVAFGPTNSAKLTAANGDVLAVEAAEREIPVRTSFGKVELAVNSIRSIQISQNTSLDQFLNADGTEPKPPFHIAYVVPAGTVGNQALPVQESQTLGNDFDVNDTIQITALGVFDSGGDGLIGRLHARIYDRDTRSSLADLEFTAENPGTLVGGSRFLTLKHPLLLEKGFHGVISVAYLGTTALETDGNARVSPGNWTLDGDDGAISFVGMSCHSQGGTGDAFPDIEDPSPVPNNFAAGTFIYRRMP